MGYRPEGGAAGPSGGRRRDAVALAEHWHGAGRDVVHLLVVAATRRGVGSALLLRGALYTGSTGLAMEAGHVSIDPHGRPCPCGSRGCLNVETDAGRFLDAAGHVPDPGTAPLDAAIALLTAGYAPTPGSAPPRAPSSAASASASPAWSTSSTRTACCSAGCTSTCCSPPGRAPRRGRARSPWDRGAAVPISPCALDDAALIGAAELAWQPVLDNPAILRSPA